MRVRTALVAALAAVFLLVVSPAFAGLSKKSKAVQAVDFLDMVFNQKKVKEGFDKYVGDKYIQHNPIAPDGAEAAVNILGGFLKQVPTWSYTFKHSYVDGDIVIIHSHVRAKPEDRGNAVIDIFRFEKGKIVEHWDVIQAIPEKSANENTMF